MLVLYWLLFAYIWNSVRGEDFCARQLEEVIFRPKVCGIEYFEKLSCELNARLFPVVAARISELCELFSEENQVDLSILNADGIDLCTMKNPTANAYTLIGKSLLLRSASDRRLVYLYYEPTTPHLPLPPAESPDLDAIGILFIYNNITRTFSNRKQDSLIPYVLSVVDYINSYTDSGPQQSPDLQYAVTFATIAASVLSALATAYFSEVLSEYLNGSAEFAVTYPSFNTGVFLTETSFFPQVSQDGVYPLNVRVENYDRMKNIMLKDQGAASIQKSFAQFVPINAYENGVCSYAYNLHLPYGKLVRVIFSQTELLFKK